MSVGAHERLVLMANQIARNLAAMEGPRAAAAVADHIASFWDPRMKAAILADRSRLDPVAAEAIDLLASRAHPPHQSGATQFTAPGEADRSDAG
ncbi:MAG: formate dehydrogenase subunit delta [Sphingomonas sp.]|uniref:formate dehydrogenase subunit delta n=1 Tax=Sphingomonas sp. TaxID=28214 RepID=UPI003F81E974